MIASLSVPKKRLELWEWITRHCEEKRMSRSDLILSLLEKYRGETESVKGTTICGGET